MDHQEIVWIKKEETDVVPDVPVLEFLEDPLKTELPGLSIKSDPELTSCVESSETNFLEDPLKAEVPVLSRKPDPELKSCVESSETNVVGSTRGTSNSTRLIQNRGENWGISLKETHILVAVPNELKINAEESKHSTIFDTQRHKLDEESEDDLLVTRLQCSRRENEFQKLICSFCLRSFDSKYRLTMHVFIHMDGLQPPPYVCKSCGEVFLSDTKLNKHLKFSEGDQASSAAHIDQFDHIYKHENVFLEGGRDSSVKEHTEQQLSSQPKTEAFPATGTKGSHKCNVCEKLFTKLRQLKRHSLIHTGQRPHKCNICGKSFALTGTLKDHVLIHTGQRPHKCKVCGKSFIQSSALKRHSLLHTGLRPHKCDVCGLSFIQLGHLKQHSVIHTGQRPHKCNVCEKSFSRLDLLKIHLLLHIGQRLHKCNLCGKSFTQSGSLKSHLLVHTGQRPHKCNICGKSFTVLGDLKKHSLIHTGQRPHKCKVCGKSFTLLGYLKRHSLIHTDQ